MSIWKWILQNYYVLVVLNSIWIDSSDGFFKDVDEPAGW
jgi:hypothetical protein